VPCLARGNRSVGVTEVEAKILWPRDRAKVKILASKLNETKKPFYA